MGSPDGGWYDERPPMVVSSSPADRGINVRSNKVTLNFSEYVKLENATEKVVISPPQKEQPEFKAHGKKIVVELKDTLQPDMTYTIDFSDAISDNNEGNPLGNYTYSFSTGDRIDTLEVAGYVLEAKDLEPVKGVLVGLYKADEANDSTPKAQPDTLGTFLRVSRTDSRGYFVIRGVAPGKYTVGAVNDVDGDFRFSQRGEKMAFSHQVVSPSCFPDHRQDTIWADTLHVKDILVVPYTHFMPDDVVLLAFDHELTERYYLKSERKEPDNFTLFFTAPLDTPQVASLPKLRLLNGAISANSPQISADTLSERTHTLGKADGPFVVEPSLRGDTITYWLRDTALINQDTLRIEMQTLITDSAGVLQPQTDTLEILAKTPYAKRMKAKQDDYEKWKKSVEKAKKKYEKEVAMRRREGLSESDPEFYKGLHEVDTIQPVEPLKPKYTVNTSMDPDGTVYIEFPKPMARISADSIHLYVEQDSVWYKAPFTFEPEDSIKRKWRLFTDWIPEAEYSLEIDTLAFEDIYGNISVPYKTGIKVQALATYASLFVNISGIPDTCHVIVQLVDNGDKAVRSVKAKKGTAEFYYVQPATYYLRAIVDSNNNGIWDTGDYYADREPEQVYYNNKAVECKAKWDLTRDWNLTATPRYQQKPDKITKQKAEKQKTIKQRNLMMAVQKGLLPTDIPEKFRKQ